MSRFDAPQQGDETGLVNERHLPALTTTAAPGPSLLRGAPKAAFLSQLIAERHHLAPQRQRRRAALGDAVATYKSSRENAVLRIPAGYRTTLVV